MAANRFSITSNQALKKRLLSAVVLAPPVLSAVYFGSPYFDLLVLIAAMVMVWEWRRMGGFARDRMCLAIAGIFYIAIPCYALLWLRGSQEAGRETMLWLFALVWAADSGAYAFGMAIGGPKLASVISPKKTWAGLFGAIFCAGIIGLAAALALGKSAFYPFILASMILGAVSQAGDLLESWIKRRFNVKDASNIIPGHGGVLDRVDGLLAAAAAAALFELLIGDGLLSWL